ncbi:hypothetical protein [Lysobacter sp. CA199]|uniref:hypothetical protein n=1 Tax=Lysobacter sp. CA199 TaxID=3455608 RepID=UPI003F8D7A28
MSIFPWTVQFIADIGDQTRDIATSHHLDCLLTAVIPLYHLSDPQRAMEIASILSGSKCERMYLTFLVEDIPQRQPLKDSSALASAIHLVRMLSKHLRVHVAFCAHDLVLWKAAGAADISSGKYLNVRRFSPSRWSPEEREGRMVPSWNDERLLTLTRDQEVLRLDRVGWHNDIDIAKNPASLEILSILRSGTGKPWLRLSWIQFLNWCVATEREIRSIEAGDVLLRKSYDDWTYAIEELKLLFTDRFNDGAHVREWLNAIREGGAR